MRYRSLQIADGGVIDCRLESPAWEAGGPYGLDVASLCHLRVLLVRTLRKVEDELDRQDLNYMRRATTRIDTGAAAREP